MIISNEMIVINLVHSSRPLYCVCGQYLISEYWYYIYNDNISYTTNAKRLLLLLAIKVMFTLWTP